MKLERRRDMNKKKNDETSTIYNKRKKNEIREMNELKRCGRMKGTCRMIYWIDE